MGYIKAKLDLANNDRQLKHLKNSAESAASMSDIAVVQSAEEKKKKKTTKLQDLIKLVPDAIMKFNEKDCYIFKLAKNEITAVLMGCYGGGSAEEKKEAILFKKNQEDIDSDRTKITTDVAAMGAPTAPIEAAVAAAMEDPTTSIEETTPIESENIAMEETVRVRVYGLAYNYSRSST